MTETPNSKRWLVEHAKFGSTRGITLVISSFVTLFYRQNQIVLESRQI